MADLVLHTKKDPSYFNKDTAIGALGLPAAIGLASTALGFVIAPWVPFVAMAAGAVMGSVAGKARMEKEQTHGKVVSDKPKFFNKDTLLGGLIGHMLGSFAGIAAGVAVFLAGLPSMTAELTPQMVEAGMASAVPVMWAVAIGGTLLGAVLGGRHGVKRQEKEYAEAQQQQQQQEVSRGRGHAQTMEVGQEPSINFAKKIEQERALAAQHQHSV